MEYKIRRSEERGKADHGWLKAKHSFSFADYYDAEHMGFRSLRVINQDIIAPGAGFPMHPHQDMEIFTYVTEGEIEHEDNIGNRESVGPGKLQLMSAGSGIYHSERNASDSEELRLLQIWIEPKERGLDPSYTEWKASQDEQPGKTLVISPDGREQSAKIHQDAYVYSLRVDSSETMSHSLAAGRGLWLQLIEGSLEIFGETLEAGDSISFENLEYEEAEKIIQSKALTPVEALLFDLK